MFLRKSFLIGSVLVAALFFGLPQVLALEVDCNDSVDNDADGYIDCLDVDCAATTEDCAACCAAAIPDDPTTSIDERRQVVCNVTCLLATS